MISLATRSVVVPGAFGPQALGLLGFVLLAASTAAVAQRRDDPYKSIPLSSVLFSVSHDIAILPERPDFLAPPERLLLAGENASDALDGRDATAAAPSGAVDAPLEQPDRPVRVAEADPKPAGGAVKATNASAGPVMLASAIEAGVPEPEASAEPLLTELYRGNNAQYKRALHREPTGNTIPRHTTADYSDLPPDTADSRLSLKDVVIYTLKNNPDIGIALYQSEDSRYAIRGAQAAFLPSVDLSAAAGLENAFIEDGEGSYGLNRREASIRVSQRLFDFGRSSQALKRAKALYQSRELAYKDTVEDTVFRAVSAYLDLLSQTELLENARLNVAEHEEIYELVRLNYSGGNTSEAELKRAQTRLDRARTAALDFENRRENAIGNFINVVGLRPGLLVAPQIDVGPAFRLTETTLDETLFGHDKLQAVVRDGNSIEHQEKAAKRAYLPEISLEVTGRYQDNVLANTAFSTEGRAMVAATWNLYDGGGARARVNQLRARARENEQRLIKQRNELRQEAINILSVLRTTQDKKEIFDEQVDSSKRVVTLYSKQFEAGRRTLLELLDAQADFAAAREESIANKYENLSAAFASLRFQNILTPTLSDQLSFRYDQEI